MKLRLVKIKNLAILFFAMNLPNTLTFLRAIMSFMSAIFLCLTVKYSATLGFLLFFVAGSTDWFDGYLARKYNLVTVLGKFMDALIDKIMVIGMFLVLLGLGLYGSGWTVFAIFCTFFATAREFFVSGVRMLAAAKGIVLAAENLGKYKAALQMYSIGAIIFAHMLAIDFSWAGSFLYNLSFYSGVLALGVSTCLAVISGAAYLFRYSYLFKS